MNLSKTKLGCAILFIAGVSLCIGGIWLAPLLVPGAAFIAGALGMFAESLNQIEESRTDATPQRRPVLTIQRESWEDDNRHHHITETYQENKSTSEEFQSANDSDDETRRPGP